MPASVNAARTRFDPTCSFLPRRSKPMPELYKAMVSARTASVNSVGSYSTPAHLACSLTV